MKKKILIVDDDQHIRNSLSAILNSEGYNTGVAEDKSAVFKQINENKPDLILLDVHITSEQEGYDIAQELLNDKNYKDIPVVILTSTEIVSGNNKIVDLARKFRNNPQFEYINAILDEEKGEKILEYKSEKTGEIVRLPIEDVVSKPIETSILLETLERVLQ